MKWTIVFLLVSLKLATIQGSELTLYVYPPSIVLDWTSPKSLLRSFLKITLEKHKQEVLSPSTAFTSDYNETGSVSTNYLATLGHTIAHITCQLPDGKLYDRWSSLSGQNYPAEEYQQTIKNKIGVGILFHKYVDGHIVSGQENYKRLVHYKGPTFKNTSGQLEMTKPKYISFSIDKKQCQDVKEMVDFFESFHFPKETSLEELKKRPASKTLYFTNEIDPYESYVLRKKGKSVSVGGGCAPFAIGLIKIAGLFLPSFETNWSHYQSISSLLIGGTIDSFGKKNEVELTSLLFGNLGNNWNYSGRTSKIVRMYYTQYIWNDILSVENCLGQATCELSSLKAEVQILGKQIKLGPPQYLIDTFKSGGKINRVTQKITGIQIY